MARTARKRTLEVVPDPPAAGLVDAVADFLAGLRAEGVSPRTMDYYGNVLERIFLPWAQERGIAEFSQLDQRAVDEFAGYLLDRPGRPLAKSSAASYLRAVRHFVRWTQEQKLTSGLAVRPVKVPRPLLEVLDKKEINLMEAAADAERDKLIVRVLADCGLRLSELLGLTAADIVQQGSSWYLRIMGRSYGGGAKGDRSRMVPVRPDVARRLHKLATKGRQPDAFSDRIFVSLRRQRSGLYEPLDPRGVQTMLKAVAVRAGITKRVYPHLLRHSYVTNALRSGMNPLLVAQVAGHSDLSMIASTYSHLDRTDAYKAMAAFWADDGS
jgi:site-specific recombinase XerD